MLFLITFACNSQPTTALFREQAVRVTDMHLHTGNWQEIAPKSQSYLASFFPFPFGLSPEALVEQTLSPEGVISELDKAGIDSGILFATYAPRSVGVATNDFVESNVQYDPSRLYGLSSLSVEQWELNADEQLEALDKSLENPSMIGVKLAHTHQHFRMDDPAYYDIYKIAAAHSAPVYLHTGPSPFLGTKTEAPYINPNYLEEAISEHPDTDFILGHLGFDFEVREHRWLMDCIRLAETYPNVWLEPSALGSSTSDPTGEVLIESYTRIQEAGLVDRIIYGSDGPQRPGFLSEYLERSIVAMEASGYSVEEAQLVLQDNANRAYGLSTEDTGGEQ